MVLDDLKLGGFVPEFYDDASYQTVINGYLYKDETPKQMYKRLAKTSASYYNNDKKYEKKLFDFLWKGWLCPATPVAANFGTNRALPISCFSFSVDDTTDDIFQKNHELAILSKHGGGIGVFLGRVRGGGEPISKGGVSGGVIPWAKVYDSTTVAVSQGSTRRGASAVYLPIDHKDIEEFLDLRRPTGDPNRRCMNLHHAVTITDAWMNSMLAGDLEKRKIWKKILTARFEQGEPYLFFTDNVNNQNPECYKANNLNVETSNICSEITLHTDPNHTFVCCLSSLNLSKWDEWKDTDLVEVAVRFLDSVIEEFIQKASYIRGFENAVRSAVKGRAIGIGVLGYHTLLQSKMLPFDSFESMMLNNLIFKIIKERADKETRNLAKELGEPEWCRGFNIRNTHLIALAPTASNSIISGGVSPSIEPIAANIFSQKTAKGTFIRKNKQLESLLSSKGMNNDSTWKSITVNNGSVQHLTFLTKEEKDVFLTAKEINQFALVKQAAQRQKHIDQGQSLNLFFAENSDPKYINDVHLEAWRSGLKTLYYCRTEGVLKGDLANRDSTDCSACEA